MYGINTRNHNIGITIKACGKVNLGLDVVGKRADGYHLVRMIMQTVDVWDELTLECSRNTSAEEFPDAAFFVDFFCNEAQLPTDDRNLAVRAAHLIGERCRLKGRLKIELKKQIPMAAGMAGGSADAAGVIRGMNQLYELHLSQKEQDEIALMLGADVPFCLRKGTWLAEGIGEKLQQVSDLPSCYMVIVKPPIGVSTPWAYRALDESKMQVHPDIDRLLAALKQGSISEICQDMGNILEPVVASKYPVIREIEQKLMELGAVKALMSGSGPTVFGIFTEEEKADQAVSYFEGGDYGQFKVEF